jgi:hypothetical protein
MRNLNLIVLNFFFAMVIQFDNQEKNYENLNSPIKLSLKLSNSKFGNILKWQNLSNRKVDYFIIQKSIDSKKYLNLTSIKNRNQKWFKYIDPMVEKSEVYYRIILVDFEGNFRISKPAILKP